MTTLKTHGLSGGSLYKILYLGLLFPMLVFGLGCGIAAYLGHSTVKFNEQNVFGLEGLLVGTVLGIVLPIFLSAGLWVLMSIGIWVWTRLGPIQLTLKD